MKKLLYVIYAFALAACTAAPLEWVSTTCDSPWVQTMLPADIQAEGTIVVDTDRYLHSIEGFGTCFNELGWASLSELTAEDRDGILKELFTPEGVNLTMGRMPVGANDFSIRYYSYAEREGDFDLESFTIAHDGQYLIPFIKAAQSLNPGIKIWASPWCPPAWMKMNGHYACAASCGNGLAEDKQIPEGTDAFILDERYLDCYARYFGKFIDAYKACGIDVFMVMPQNEPNSDQCFPSCTWTPYGLATFIKYLGPEMDKRGVDVYLGTIERADPELWEHILKDPDAGKHINGMGFQWAGKDALPALHERYPELPCYQTEQECGNGLNDWNGAMHSWDLMLHYLKNGVQSYFYWNTSLYEGGISTWGWRQNSLVVVDKEKKTFRYTPEYYLMKHFSHYVQPGAKVLDLGDDAADAIAFLNPDGKTVVAAANRSESEKGLEIRINGRKSVVSLPAGSISTFLYQ